jgi:hypothetical protein
MKRIPATALAIVLTVTLAACSSTSAPTTATPSVKATTSNEPEQPTPTVKMWSYPTDTFSYVVTDSNGYQTEYTLSIGSWLKSADTDEVTRAWHSVGGKSDLPPVYNGIHSSGYGWSQETEFDWEHGIVAVGNAKIENITPNFERHDWEASISLRQLYDGKSPGSNIPVIISTAVQGAEYSNASRTSYMGGSSSTVGISLSGNKSGSVPFVIGIGGVFTPKFPDGDPCIDKVSFSMNTENFKIAKSWEEIEPISLLELPADGTSVGYRSFGFAIKPIYILNNKFYADGNVAGLGGVSNLEFDGSQELHSGLFQRTDTGYGGHVQIRGGDATATFSETNLYQTLCGKIAVSRESVNCSGVTTVKIYADDKLVYENSEIKADTPPIYFEVDINRAHRITVETGYVGEDTDAPAIALVDAMLYPQGYDIPAVDMELWSNYEPEPPTDEPVVEVTSDGYSAESAFTFVFVDGVIAVRIDALSEDLYETYKDVIGTDLDVTLLTRNQPGADAEAKAQSSVKRFADIHGVDFATANVSNAVWLRVDGEDYNKKSDVLILGDNAEPGQWVLFIDEERRLLNGKIVRVAG